jgi:hypothetical protein
VVTVTGFFIARHFWRTGEEKQGGSDNHLRAGAVITSYRNVPVRSNGADYTVSHGKHYADDSYYYGQKWQCVEFVKRFYHDAFDHHMPDVWGHARDFYDPETSPGTINAKRGMWQFENGGPIPPQADDLLVFDFPPFGHVAVISEVRGNEIEVIQQNVTGKPREVHALTQKGDRFFVETERKPVAWLRLPSRHATKPTTASN